LCEPFAVGDFPFVEPEGLFIHIAVKMPGFYTDIGAFKASNKTASDPVNQAEEAERRGRKQFSRMSCGESSLPPFPPRPPALKAGAGASPTVPLSPAFFSCCAPPSPGRTDPRSWAGAAA